MKITNVKAIVAKGFTVGLLAGAVALAAPSKAQAQVSFGIHIGVPVYSQPVYVRPGYGYAPAYSYAPAYAYDRDRRFDSERREAMEREQRERFEHQNFDRGYGDRDHGDHDRGEYGR